MIIQDKPTNHNLPRTQHLILKLYNAIAEINELMVGTCKIFTRVKDKKISHKF